MSKNPEKVGNRSSFERVKEKLNSRTSRLLTRIGLVFGFVVGGSGVVDASAQESNGLEDRVDSARNSHIIEKNLAQDNSTWELESNPDLEASLSFLTPEEVLNKYTAFDGDEGDGTDPETPAPPTHTVTINSGGSNLRTAPEIANNIDRVANAGDEFAFIRTINGANVLSNSVWYELTKDGFIFYAHSSTTGEPTPTPTQDNQESTGNNSGEPITQQEPVPAPAELPTTNDGDGEEVELTPAPEDGDDGEVVTASETLEGEVAVNQNEVFDSNNEYTGTLWTGENAVNPEDFKNIIFTNEGVTINGKYHDTPPSIYVSTILERDAVRLNQEDRIVGSSFECTYLGVVGERVISAKLTDAAGNLVPEFELINSGVFDLACMVNYNGQNVIAVYSIPKVGVNAGLRGVKVNFQTPEELFRNLTVGNRVNVSGENILINSSGFIDQMNAYRATLTPEESEAARIVITTQANNKNFPLDLGAIPTQVEPVVIPIGVQDNVRYSSTGDL